MQLYRQSGVLVGLLCGAGLCMAQVTGAGDAADWSAFMPATSPSVVKPDWQLRSDVQRAGPWSRASSDTVSSATQELMALLAGQRWSDALTALKERNPEVNRPDEQGRTPLGLAAQAGQVSLVRELLRRGANPDQTGPDGRTPLGLAAWEGHVVVVKDLLRQGAQVALPDRRGKTPLHRACAGGHLPVVKTLIEAGADWRTRDTSGRHALQDAAYFGRLDILQWLAEQGASMSEPDAHGLNALHTAALGDQLATVAWLQARGVTEPHVLTHVLIARIGQPAAR